MPILGSLCRWYRYCRLLHLENHRLNKGKRYEREAFSMTQAMFISLFPIYGVWCCSTNRNESKRDGSNVGGNGMFKLNMLLAESYERQLFWDCWTNDLFLDESSKWKPKRFLCIEHRYSLQIYSAWIQCAGISTFGTIHVKFPYNISISGSSLNKYVKFIVICKRNLIYSFSKTKNIKSTNEPFCERTWALSVDIEKLHFMQEYSSASSDDA